MHRVKGLVLSAFVCIGLMLGAGVLSSGKAAAYPIDAYAETGIRRLEFNRLGQLGKIRNARQIPTGGKLPLSAIKLGLVSGDAAASDLPAADASLSQLLSCLVPAKEREKYGIALLDYSDPNNPVYAELNADFQLNIGSVGKMVIGLSIFQVLADIYPDSVEDRKRVLKESKVVANVYSQYDHHKIPIYYPDTGRFSQRAMREGDSGSLWEFLDWMYSASANSAASMVIQQAMLLDEYREAYPPSLAEINRFLKATSAKEEGDRSIAVMDAGLTKNGISIDTLRQGSYFTRGGKYRALGTKSIGSPKGLIQMMQKMESGQLVDSWSSLEMKRLMYITQRRIRYASHPALRDAALYFKSGSLYSCKPEEGFTCGKYMGNRKNYLASLAIVEWPAENPQHRYAVAMTSNVLRKNSAIAHQTIAGRIHTLITNEDGKRDRLTARLERAGCYTPEPDDL